MESFRYDGFSFSQIDTSGFVSDNTSEDSSSNAYEYKCDDVDTKRDMVPSSDEAVDTSNEHKEDFESSDSDLNVEEKQDFTSSDSYGSIGENEEERWVKESKVETPRRIRLGFVDHYPRSSPSSDTSSSHSSEYSSSSPDHIDEDEEPSNVVVNPHGSILVSDRIEAKPFDDYRELCRKIRTILPASSRRNAQRSRRRRRRTRRIPDAETARIARIFKG